MALRQTFGEVIERVRNEARLSSNSSRGVDHLEHIKEVIVRNYETLAEEHDWKHLELNRTSPLSRKVLTAGQRYYDFPTTLNTMRIERVWVKWGSHWTPVEQGIGYAEYSAYDPSLNQRSDPVLRWEWYGSAQFEVWPVPASTGTADGNSEIAFDGVCLAEPLIADESRLDVDDWTVILFAAAEISLGNGAKERAQILGDRANSRLMKVKGALGSTRSWGMGTTGGTPRTLPRHPTYIR